MVFSAPHRVRCLTRPHMKLPVMSKHRAVGEGASLAGSAATARTACAVVPLPGRPRVWRCLFRLQGEPGGRGRKQPAAGGAPGAERNRLTARCCLFRLQGEPGSRGRERPAAGGAPGAEHHMLSVWCCLFRLQGEPGGRGRERPAAGGAPGAEHARVQLALAGQRRRAHAPPAGRPPPRSMRVNKG